MVDSVAEVQEATGFDEGSLTSRINVVIATLSLVGIFSHLNLRYGAHADIFWQTVPLSTA